MAECPPDQWTVTCETKTHRIEENLQPAAVPAGATTFTITCTTYDSDNAAIAQAQVQVYGPGGALTGKLTVAINHDSQGQTTLGPSIIPAGATQLRFNAVLVAQTYADAIFVAGGDVIWGGTCDPTRYCEYGTQPQEGAQGLLIITEAAVAVALTATGIPLLAALFGGLIGMSISIPALCSVNPVSVPQSIITWSQGGSLTLPPLLDILTFFKLVIWRTYCECTPGAGGDPAPTPPPTPTLPPPNTTPPTSPPPTDPGLPPPPILCDGADLCTSLNRIMNMLSMMNVQIGATRADVTLIQRQHVPFASRHGRTFSGLDGSDTLAVQGILGLSVAVTAAPAYLSSDMDTLARSSYFYGWLNLGTSDGWLRKVKLTHNPHLLLEIGGDVTRVEYHFNEGVEANITEILREL